MFEEFLAKSRDKWRELPAGGESLDRTFSSDLLVLDDDALMARWNVMNDAARLPDVRGWFQELYIDTFAGRRVVEVGSGFGFDGIHFLRHGAHWTFSDLVAENLAVVRRVVEYLGLGARATYLHVGNVRAFASLPPERFDAVWAIGALHHAPFEIARIESLDLLRHLKKGGRWIELTYPHERWLREGAVAFTEFGKRTDGERTPWAEWYDLQKVKMRLFPTRTTTILDFTTGGGNFGWLDLRIDEVADDASMQSRGIDLRGRPTKVFYGSFKWRRQGLQLVCRSQMWSFCGTIDLRSAIDELGKPPLPRLNYAVDLEIEVGAGSVGLVLTGENAEAFVGREHLIDARPTTRRVTVSTMEPRRPAHLLIRNSAEGVASRALVRAATLRFAA